MNKTYLTIDLGEIISVLLSILFNINFKLSYNAYRFILTILQESYVSTKNQQLEVNKATSKS